MDGNILTSSSERNNNKRAEKLDKWHLLGTWAMDIWG